jgi:type I restriction enzyme, S subunit
MQKIFSQEIRFKDDNGEEFPKWDNKKFKECLGSLSTRDFQIKSTEFKSAGKYKVIDQGQALIAGYYDDDDLVFKNVPIIVFGDHTTILKYIDFEFIVGADGTKLLKNKVDFDLKYLFFNLSFNNIPQEGYKRHFTMLSCVILQIPTLSEQTKIANFLSAIDDKINHTQKQIEKTEVWKKGLMQQMFV